MREDDDVGRAVQGQARHRLVRPADDELVGVGEAFFGREFRPRVDHGHAVAHQLGEPVQRDGDVDRANDDQLSGSAERLYEPIAVAARELSARGRS